MAAAGGEKLKAALRQIYDEEDVPSRSPSGGVTDHIKCVVMMDEMGAFPLKIQQHRTHIPNQTKTTNSLSGAQMGDAGVEHLALALRVSKTHRTVRLLNLSRCDIGDHGTWQAALSLCVACKSAPPSRDLTINT